jgi:molecular chaperone GrpE
MTEETINNSEEVSDNFEAKFQLFEEEAQEYKDKYLRLLAEIENTRKRMQKEKLEMARFAVENVVAEFLAPMDNLENALSFAGQGSEEIRNWAAGFEMILAQFKEALNQHGIVPFVSEGTLFDPHMHEAVEMEETDDVPAGTILKEFVRGYKSKDYVLRPAKVRVAKAITQNQDQGE